MTINFHRTQLDYVYDYSLSITSLDDIFQKWTAIRRYIYIYIYIYISTLRIIIQYTEWLFYFSVRAFKTSGWIVFFNDKIAAILFPKRLILQLFGYSFF